MSPGSSSLASALLDSNQSQSPTQATTSNNVSFTPSASTSLPGPPHVSSMPIVAPSPSVTGGSPTPSLTTSSATNTQPLSASLNTPSPPSSTNPAAGHDDHSVQLRRMSNTPIEQPVISKVKKKKKKVEWGIESLIQADIQDLHKRGAVAPHINTEAVVTPHILTSVDALEGGPTVPEVIPLDHDDEPTSETSHPPSTRDILVAGTSSTSKTNFMETNMIVDQPIQSVPLQNNAQSTNTPDIDLADGENGDLGRVSPQVLRMHDRTPLQILHTSTAEDSLVKDVTDTGATSIHTAPVETSVGTSLSDAMDVDESPPPTSPPPTSPSPTSPPSTNSPFSQQVPFSTGVRTEARSSIHAPDDNGSLPPENNELLQDIASSAVSSVASQLDMGVMVDNGPPPTPNSELSQQIASSSSRIIHDVRAAVDNDPSAQVTLPATTLDGIINELPASLDVQPVLMVKFIVFFSGAYQHPFSTAPLAVTSKITKPEVIYPPPPDTKEYTADELKILNAFGSGTRTLMVLKGIAKKRVKSTIRFKIDEEQFKAIKRWNNRKDPAEEISSSICVSLACYSRTSSKVEQKSLDEICELPITWPRSHGSLSMNVMHKGQRTALPLSPPFMVGPNGLVDVSEYIDLGKDNLIELELEQFDDMCAHIFVLRMHHPTGAQLKEAMLRRQKEQAWKDWQRKMAEPLDTPIASFENS
ncbi:hypothetical protein C0991_009792 [Blastosporella zonata]|nr:hypothetical protein C0991_009792 [Blastosporella zonata]